MALHEVIALNIDINIQPASFPVPLGLLIPKFSSIFFLVTNESIPITGGAAEKAAGITCEGAAWDLIICRILLVLDSFCLVKPYIIPKWNVTCLFIHSVGK